MSMPRNAAKSILLGSCAEVTEKCFPSFTSVSGNPARRGAASAEETPGTSSYAHRACVRASISLLARENTAGHPPLSLATTFPSSQSFTSRASMSGWVHERSSPPRLPTCTRVADGGASSRRDASDAPRSSWTTTSHARRRRSARTVRWSMPPGPAPMRNTFPFRVGFMDMLASSVLVVPSAAARAGLARRRRVYPGGRRGGTTARWGTDAASTRLIAPRVVTQLIVVN